MMKTRTANDWTMGSNGSSMILGALIAAVVLAMGMYFALASLWNQAMRFERPHMSEVAMRGADGQARPPTYTQDDVDRFGAMLRRAMVETYKEKKPDKGGFSWFGPIPSQVRMTMEFRELPDRSFIMELVSFKRVGGQQVRDKGWVWKFPNAERYEARVKDFASQVVQELWAPPAESTPPAGI